MNLKVNVGISNRHVHLTEETYNQLFDNDMVNVKDLKQTNEFATDSFVTIKGNKGTIEKVRVLGPFRSYNQVEISKSDAFLLGITPPIRKSGDLAHSETITLSTTKATITLENSCIIAQAHIHMNFEDLEKYSLKDDQIVQVEIDGERQGTIGAHVKASKEGILEFHIDRDEANAFLINNDQELNVKL